MESKIFCKSKLIGEVKSYKIYATLHSEVKKGTVWTYKEFDDISLIKITNTDNKKSIIVAYRFIDNNFEKKYNESKSKEEYKINNTKQPQPIIIDDYYRKKLGDLTTQKYYSFKIEPVKSYWYRLRYLREHSDEVVRITYWLAQLSIIISFFSYFVPIEKLQWFKEKILLFLGTVSSC